MTLIVIRGEDFKDIFISPNNGEPEHVTFLRRGHVIVPDSSTNEWLYIVMTGTCHVMKALEAVSPIRTPERRHRPILLCSLACPEYGRITTEKTFVANRAIAQHAIQEYDTDDECDVPPITLRPTTCGDAKSKENTKGLDSDRSTMASAPPGRSRSKFKYTPRNAKCVPVIAIEKEKGEKENMNKPRPPVNASNVVPAITYVNLRTLRPTDVFGLEEVDFEEDNTLVVPRTSVLLVSNGAELVMLKRDFFMKNANETVQKGIRANVWPYPDDGSLQASCLPS
ncbi:hypothetical protein LSAT2_022234 [Lamellibrachia satsuma]|nr:hypothetical protein LSAT2_022234 [Lamellibrachia satsuma]